MRGIEKIVGKIKNDESVAFSMVAEVLLRDMLIELNNLNGIEFVNGAVEVIKILETVDYLKT